MSGLKIKHSVWFRVFVVVAVCLFLLNNIAWALVQENLPANSQNQLLAPSPKAFTPLATSNSRSIDVEGSSFSRKRPKIEKGRIGVYPVGALSMSFYERMNAEYLICQKISPTTDWAMREGKIIINGEERDFRENMFRGLVHTKKWQINKLPEIIIVSPYADHLEAFLDEIIEYFQIMDERGEYDLEDVPKFLLSSSGIYLEDALKEIQRKVDESELTNKEFFKEAIDRRVFRGVAYQAGVREGTGEEANYLIRREAGAYVELSLNGTSEDRKRITDLIRGRGYDIRVEERYLKGEYDKGLVNIIFSAFTQLYGVMPAEKKLIDVRFGDLFGNSKFLPDDFEPQQLTDGPDKIREKIEKIGQAFVDIAKAKGVYDSDVTFKSKFEKVEEYILQTFPHHQPSSFQLLREKLFDTEADWKGDELLTTEAYIIKPMIRIAEELGDTKNAEILKGLERDLLESYKNAVKIRDEGYPMYPVNSHPARIVQGDSDTWDVATDSAVIRGWDKETVRSVREEETLGRSFRNRWAFVDVTVLIGQALKLQLSKETLIPLVKKHIENRDGRSEILLEGYDIDGVDEVKVEDEITAFTIPIKRNGVPTYTMKCYLADDNDSDTYISLSDGTNVYIKVEGIPGNEITWCEALEDFMNRGEAPFKYEESLLLNNFQSVAEIVKGEYAPPPEIEILPTTKCNLRCSFCLGQDKMLGSHYSLTKDELIALIESINRYNQEGDSRVKRIRFAGVTGEPLLNKYTVDAMGKAIEDGYEIGLVTNGTLLDERVREVIVGGKYIHISLDAARASTFQKIKRVKPDLFDAAIHNTRELIKLKRERNSSLEIGMGFILSEDNWRELSLFIDMARDMGADYVRVRAPEGLAAGSIQQESWTEIYRILEEQSKKDIGNPSFRIILTDETKRGTERPDFDSCPAHALLAMINANKGVYPCAHTVHRENLSFGEGVSFKDIWEGNRRRSVIEKELVPSRDCPPCPPRAARVNRFLVYLIEEYRKNPNFLSWLRSWANAYSLEKTQRPITERSTAARKKLMAESRIMAMESAKNNMPKEDMAKNEEVHSTLFKDTLKLISSETEEAPPIVLLGTSWIKGYEEGRDLQFDALNPLISSIRSYCEERGIKFQDMDDIEILSAIEKAKEETPDAKIIVLAGECTVSGEDFEVFRKDKKTFLAGVNNEKLTVDSYIRLMEMLTITVKLAFEVPVDLDNPNIAIQRENGYYLFIPNAEPMDYEKFKAIYDMHIFA